MSELKNGSLHRAEDGQWVAQVELDGGTVLSSRFDSRRRAMGFCEWQGMKMPLFLWHGAVEQEPMADPMDNLPMPTERE